MAEDRMLSDEILLGIINSKSGGGGTTDYSQLSNKPQINGVTLSGNKSASDLSLASLDANGKVPAAQLPSYVDDVINGYLYEGHFYEDAEHQTEITGESGKIYIDLETNKTYRWSGLAFVEISESLALGETASTAYAGDKGKANADAISAIKDGQTIDSFGDVETALAYKADKSAVKTEFIGTTAEWNALTAEQKKAYDTYQITDDFIGGVGAGYSETTLYTGDGTSQASYTLTDSIDNYDLISVRFARTNNFEIFNIYSSKYLKSLISSGISTGACTDDKYSFFTVTDTTTFTRGTENDLHIIEICGMKFGGGGGGTVKEMRYTGTGTVPNTIDFGNDTPKRIIGIIPDPDEELVISNYEAVGEITWGMLLALSYWSTQSGGVPTTNNGDTNLIRMSFSGNIVTLNAQNAAQIANYSGQKYLVKYEV